jgi:L-alanine-DL-glutamate epimerase-like enolase superfamily enzyme
MRITEVIAHPLTAPMDPEVLVTAFGKFNATSLLVVEIRTDTGLVGWGEGLARYAPTAHADIVERLLRPLLVGEDPTEVERLWQRMFRVYTGKSGGVLIEALAACDIALWDILGKAAGLPLHRLLGGTGRRSVPAYASSVSWAGDEVAGPQAEAYVRQGFRMMKVKIGAPLDRALQRLRFVRAVVGPDVALCTDANWAFDLDEAMILARACLDLNYAWLEEPLVPEDVEGLRRLRAAVPIRLAAGESEHTAFGAREIIAERLVGVVQPDVARAGGITETRRIASLAHAFNIRYAPHMGQSGAICAAASLQLCSAMPNGWVYECMTYPNPLRDRLSVAPVGEACCLTAAGEMPVPEAPGLGIEVDRAVLAAFRAT